MTRVLSLLDRGYLGLIHLLAWFTIALLMIVTAWISLEVMGRVLGFGVMKGLVDFTEYAMFAMALLAAPWILHHKAHVRVMVLTEALPRGQQHLLGILADAVAAVVCVVLAWYAAENFVTSYQRDELIFSELIVPEWYLQWQAPLAFALLAVGFVREIIFAKRDGFSHAVTED